MITSGSSSKKSSEATPVIQRSPQITNSEEKIEVNELKSIMKPNKAISAKNDRK